VRHKILDIVGDFYLLGRPIRGVVHSFTGDWEYARAHAMACTVLRKHHANVIAIVRSTSKRDCRNVRGYYHCIVVVSIAYVNRWRTCRSNRSPRKLAGCGAGLARDARQNNRKWASGRYAGARLSAPLLPPIKASFSRLA
jgi:hypothetical protein